jgi:hypothetical protein
VLWILASVAIALLCYEIPTLVTAVLVPLLGNPNALQTDFHYYFDAARRFTSDSRLLYMFSDDVIAGFAYPPPAILPFVVFSKLRLGPALIVMTVASYGALIVAVRQWTRYLDRQGIPTDRNRLIAITLIVLALGPTYMNAIFGQVNAFVVASSVAFVAMAGVMPILAGTVLALGAWLKLYPALMVWVGTWDRGAWRAIGYAVAAAVVIAAISLIWLPREAYQTFAGFVLPARSGKTAIHITNQSLVAFLERFRYEPYLFLNWTGQQAVTVSREIAAINFGLLGMAAMALQKTARSPHRIAHAGATLMAMVAIFAPLGWGHTYVMALPLITLRLTALRNAGPVVTALTAAAVVALMIPAGRHLPIDWAPAFIQNIVYSRYLLATTALILTSTTAIGRAAESAGSTSA